MKTVQYRFPKQPLPQRARYLVVLLRALHKHATACWIAILGLVALTLLPEVVAQPLLLLACIGIGLLLGDQLVQWVHEYFALLTDRWVARRPSAYARRYRARPKSRLAGAAAGAILGAVAWYAFAAPQPAWLTPNSIAIGVAKIEKALQEAADKRS